MTRTERGEKTFEFGADEVPSTAVLEAVAAVSGIDLLDLPPLQHAIDVEALDQLFAASRIEELRFEYQRYEVLIGRGEIRLTERS